MIRPDRDDARVGDPFRPRTRWLTAALVVSVLVAVAVSLGMGAVQINLGEVAGVLWRRVGLDIGAEPGTQADAVLWGIRLPRIALGLLVGAAFGFTGAALQGAFRNPLADPQLLGIGPGASLGRSYRISRWWDRVSHRGRYRRRSPDCTFDQTAG